MNPNLLQLLSQMFAPGGVAANAGAAMAQPPGPPMAMNATRMTREMPAPVPGPNTTSRAPNVTEMPKNVPAPPIVQGGMPMLQMRPVVPWGVPPNGMARPPMPGGGMPDPNVMRRMQEFLQMARPDAQATEHNAMSGQSPLLYSQPGYDTRRPKAI